MAALHVWKSLETSVPRPVWLVWCPTMTYNGKDVDLFIYVLHYVCMFMVTLVCVVMNVYLMCRKSLQTSVDEDGKEKMCCLLTERKNR